MEFFESCSTDHLTTLIKNLVEGEKFKRLNKSRCVRDRVSLNEFVEHSFYSNYDRMSIDSYCNI